MRVVSETPKSIPVTHRVDVAVAGGGISGTMAALASARMGARTLIVERFGMLGGNIGPGMWAGGSLHYALLASKDDERAFINRRGIGGIPQEMVRRTLALRANPNSLRKAAEKHYNAVGARLGSDYFRDSQGVSYVIGRMMEEAGVEVLLSTYAADPIIEGGKVAGLFVENKSGRGAILCDVVVDATGDADVARRAGAATKYSQEPGMGVFYSVGCADWEGYLRGSSGDLEEADRIWMEEVFNPELGYATHGLERMIPFARKVWESGEYRLVWRLDDLGRLVTRPLRSDQHGNIISRAETNGALDPGNGRQVSLLENRIREYIFETVKFLSHWVPGFSESYLQGIAPYLGARGGRWIEAVYPVSEEDVRKERTFDDVIYVYHDSKLGKATEIPYRAMVPRKLDGLLAAGRSAVPRSPNFRARYSMLLMGQAAGIAAALCSRDGIEPRNLDCRELQRTILDWGSPIVEEKRLAELDI